jgi:hypothetical protein
MPDDPKEPKIREGDIGGIGKILKAIWQRTATRP